MKFLLKIKKTLQAGGPPTSIGLPGLNEIFAWPVWPVPGLKITACACFRQAGAGRRAGLTACFDLCCVHLLLETLLMSSILIHRLFSLVHFVSESYQDLRKFIEFYGFFSWFCEFFGRVGGSFEETN